MRPERQQKIRDETLTRNASQGLLNQQNFPLFPERFLSELPEPPILLSEPFGRHYLPVWSLVDDPLVFVARAPQDIIDFLGACKWTPMRDRCESTAALGAAICRVDVRVHHPSSSDNAPEMGGSLAKVPAQYSCDLPNHRRCSNARLQWQLRDGNFCRPNPASRECQVWVRKPL